MLLPGGAHGGASGTEAAGIAATGSAQRGDEDEAVTAAEEEPGVWGHLLAGRTERRARAGQGGANPVVKSSDVGRG